MPPTGREYEGLVIGETQRYVVQAQNDGVVLHLRMSLVIPQALVPGESVRVRYLHGEVGLVEACGPASLEDLQAERSRHIDREVDR